MRTNYKDFIASTENRHYRQINNGDGTISLVDETVYTQEGDKVSAGVLNELSQNAIWPLQYAKSGTTHQLTGLTAVSGVVSCVFTATADFVAGDTVTVDGTAYEIQLSSGDAPADKLFVSGASVAVVVDKGNKKINFKSAGGVKLPAGTWVIVKGYVSVNNVSEDFVAPVSGNYRVTVVGAGGKGASSDDSGDPHNTGGGGGSGGWARSVLYLGENATIKITCNTGVSSFGSYLSATCGGNANPYGNGGKAGTAKGGNDKNYNGVAGKTGDTGATSSPYEADGADGAAVRNSSESGLLSNTYGEGGSKFSFYAWHGGTPISKGIFSCFGAGGGGGALYEGNEMWGGEGGPGAVIIELLLKGVNDT